MIAMSEELESEPVCMASSSRRRKTRRATLSNPTIRPAYDFQGKSTARLGRLLHTLAMNPGQRDDATAYAMKQAIALVARGDLEATLSILEYAHRRALTDVTISLATSLVRLALGDPLAAEPLERLTRHTSWCDLWMALIQVRMRFGDTEQALVDLQHMLSHIAVPRSEPDIELATIVSQRADVGGWCGLDNSGRLTIGIEQEALRDLVLVLDGAEIPCLKLRQSSGIHELRLPRHWQKTARAEVLLHGCALIGSPIDVAHITQVEGFVELDSTSGALRGWCRFPAERERVPAITVAAAGDPGRRLSIRAGLADSRSIGGDEFSILHTFAVAGEKIATLGSDVRVIGPHGRALYGSPVRTRWSEDCARKTMLAVAQFFPLSKRSRTTDYPRLAGETPEPVAWTVPPRGQTSTKRLRRQSRPVDVVIPVYRGRDATLACIASVRAHRETNERIIVIADGSPERDLIAALSSLADQAEIELHVEAANRGYPGAANIGLRLAAGHDVILLNADTIVTPGWLTGLRAALYSAPDIGTATPLSNNATIFSYPRHDEPNPCPDAASATDIAVHAADVNRGEIIEVPTGHAFCLYIRAECLEETGLLREDLFAQGYGEENDFCMRARHLGWRHVATPGVFVAHQGARSFDVARDDLMRRNLGILNRLHVGYNEMIGQWVSQDPLAQSRRRIDLARLQSSAQGRDGVLVVTHNRDGGVRQHVAERLAVIAETGQCAILLQPEAGGATNGGVAAYVARVDTGYLDEFPNLRFRLPDERASLISCLEACNVCAVEVHSLIGHADTVIDLILGLRVPIYVMIHDYSWFCPRISLTAGDHRYCGEPAIAVCRDCIADHGTNFDGPVSPDELVDRTLRLIGVAHSIIAPSRDSARRIERRFGREVMVAHWEQPRRLTLQDISKAAGQSQPVRICVVGAIGYEKGYTNLLRCARIVAEANMPIEFVVVGYTCDDKRLLDTGAVRITGRYDRSEAIALIRAQRADFAWLPAVCPETWSYVLTQIWEAGLYVVVHDIGAQAERVRTTRGGLVVPLDIPLDRLLTLFLTPARIQSARSQALRPRDSIAKRGCSRPLKKLSRKTPEHQVA